MRVKNWSNFPPDLQVHKNWCVSRFSALVRWQICVLAYMFRDFFFVSLCVWVLITWVLLLCVHSIVCSVRLVVGVQLFF